jgi:hypothetical protein
MASPSQIRELMHAQPFRPFTVHLVDGRTFAVPHPDFISLSVNGRHRDLTIHDEDGVHLLDITLVVELHPQPQPPAGEPHA